MEVIKSSVKGTLGINYINSDHTSINGKTFRGQVPINITTYYDRLFPDSIAYGIISGYSEYIDRDMYDDFLSKNEVSIVIDTTGFDDYDIVFTKLEDARKFMDHQLDEKAQSKKLMELMGDVTISIVSRPGFNKLKDKALIYESIKHASPDEYGSYISGIFFIYEKKEDSWSLLDIVILG